MSNAADHMTAAIQHFAAAKIAHADGDDAAHEAAVQNGMSACLRAIGSGVATTHASRSGVRRSGSARDPKAVAEVRAALCVQPPVEGAWTKERGRYVMTTMTPTEARARAHARHTGLLPVGAAS
jgi:hypothetical protein